MKNEDADIWLMVGLGNPGKKYEKNRHNVGFHIIEALADGTYHFGGFSSKFQSEFSEKRVENGTKIILLKPQTYMNESGQAVGKVVRFYKIPLDRVIVFHDELDLKPGDVRVKFGGGTAGHNGLKSIKAHLGSADFWRVRIGIGHPGDRNRVSDYVLSDFTKADDIWREALDEAFAEYHELLVTEGVEAYTKKALSRIKNYLEATKDKK